MSENIKPNYVQESSFPAAVAQNEEKTVRERK